MSRVLSASTAADSIFLADLEHLHRRTSRVFLWLMVVQWIGAIAAALWVAPLTWIGREHRVHEHVWAAIILGGLLSSAPIYLALRRPSATFTRHVIAVSQALYSALLIHLTGGRIETHFHIFGSLAFLGLYRDWRVLVTATLVVTADHAFRGMFAPESVFGTALTSRWRWVEHAGWVVFEDIVLISACVQGLAEMRRLAGQRADLASGREAVEGEVHRRTEELQRTAQALRLSELETRAANRAKSDFLANMSHEIRTPMTAIIGYADLLMDPAQPTVERLESAHIIRRNGEHLLSLINDILDVSKIEAGRMTVEAIECSPVQIAREVHALMSQRAMDKGLTFQLEHATDFPSIRTDPLRLRQILVNLVGNAIKFTERGGVTLRLSTEGPANDGDLIRRIRFDIVDTGIGMSDQQVSTLFSAFSQADSSTTRRFGGTGLGLSISRNLARLMNGDVSATSEPGKGSVFTFWLDAPLAAPTAATPSRRLPAATANSRLHGRILLAEDGPDNQRLFVFHLKKAGAEVEVVGDGSKALDAVLQSQAAGVGFDLILMDMQMPEMDGYMAASELRRRGWAGPIIALTAHAMSGDRERCLAAGCNEYLAKPVSRDSLISMCERWIDPALRRAA